MTIQLSVLLWTIICFCLLMLILSKLLFGPMLKVMDERQEKIRRAGEKKQADALAYAQGQEALSAAQAEIARQGAQLAAEQVAEAEKHSAQSIADARRQSQEAMGAYALCLQQEAVEIKTKMDARRDSLVKAFADRLVS